MRRIALVVAVVVGVIAVVETAEAGRLPKPAPRLKPQQDVHSTAALHKPRGPEAPRKGIEKIPADQNRDERRSHGLREQ